MGSTSRIKTSGNFETQKESHATEAKPELECVKEMNQEQRSAAEKPQEIMVSVPNGENSKDPLSKTREK